MIASTICLYPVHLQRIPSTDSITCSRVGVGFRFRRAVATRTAAGVQKPHCNAPNSTNFLWTVERAPSFARPSMVVMLCPFASTARIRHDLTGWSLRRTVQRPQSPRSHAGLAPVSPSLRRNNQSNVLLDSISTVYCLPFTLSSIMCFPTLTRLP